MVPAVTEVCLPQAAHSKVKGFRHAAIPSHGRRPDSGSPPANARGTAKPRRRLHPGSVDRLVDLLHSPDDGLQSRFLWMWPNAVPPRRPTRCPDAAAALEAFRRLADLPLVLGAGDERPRPFICPLEDDAAALFDQWRHEHAAVEVSGALASAFGKAPGHLLRLALVLEHLWWSGSAGYAAPPSRIGRHALSAAAALIEDYFKPMVTWVFGDAALPEVDRLATTFVGDFQRAARAGCGGRRKRRREKVSSIEYPHRRCSVSPQRGRRSRLAGHATGDR